MTTVPGYWGHPDSDEPRAEAVTRVVAAARRHELDTQPDRRDDTCSTEKSRRGAPGSSTRVARQPQSGFCGRLRRAPWCSPKAGRRTCFPCGRSSRSTHLPGDRLGRDGSVRSGRQLTAARRASPSLDMRAAAPKQGRAGTAELVSQLARSRAPVGWQFVGPTRRHATRTSRHPKHALGPQRRARWV
jgi:hypothetical protein